MRSVISGGDAQLPPHGLRLKATPYTLRSAMKVIGLAGNTVSKPPSTKRYLRQIEGI